jgi:malonyl-CoA O-methyltransferase
MNNAVQLDKRRVGASFGRAAERYDTVAALQRSIGDRLLGRLPKLGDLPFTILDVGAGTGFCTARLAAGGARVIALDLAEPMLRQVHRTVSSPVVCVCGDAESLPLQDNSVDMIFSNLALQWCLDLDPVFSGFRRVLRPGGCVVYSSFGPDTLKELRSAWAQVDRATHVNIFFDRRTVQMAMHRAGLAKPAVESELLQVRYSSVLQLMRELKGLGAHNMTLGRPRGLTGKSKLQRVVGAYEFMMPRGIVAATYEVLYGMARKKGQ